MKVRRQLREKGRFTDKFVEIEIKTMTHNSDDIVIDMYTAYALMLVTSVTLGFAVGTMLKYCL